MAHTSAKLSKDRCTCKFVLLTCLLPFLMMKGSMVLEKKVNETQVSKTVFGHLKPLPNFAVLASIS